MTPALPPSLLRRWSILLFLIGLYLLGYVHWTLFFNLGSPETFKTMFDWGREFHYYNGLRDGLLKGEIPYHVAVPDHHTDRLLGIPEVILSPQIVLLRFMEPPQFVLVNTLLAFSIGFIGLLCLRARYRLSLLPFTMLYLIFNFNGHIAAHLGTGHAIWTGYFFFPLFIWLFLRAYEEPRAGPHWIPISLVLFLIVLQGFFHGYDWCIMLLVLAAIWNPGMRRTAVLSILASFLLSACRFWPGFMTLWEKDQGYISGYTTVLDWLAGMTVSRGFDYPPTGGYFGNLGWSEFNYYIGVVAFAFLLYFGIYRRVRPEPGAERWSFAGLDIPLGIMTVLSFDYFLAITRFIPLPLISTERVASRFFGLPLLFIALFAAIRMQHGFCARKHRWETWMFLWAGALQTLFTLWDHTSLWNPFRIMDDVVRKMGQKPENWVVQRPDPLYRAVVLVSMAVTLATLVVLLILWWKARRNVALRPVSDDTPR